MAAPESSDVQPFSIGGKDGSKLRGRIAGQLWGRLHRQGVPKRHPGPVSREDIDRAVQLYGAGESVESVALALRVANSTVRRVLGKAGVQMRPQGRRRSSG
jgi:DNA invertase Pin-like site-specific DNA recombinase